MTRPVLSRALSLDCAVSGRLPEHAAITATIMTGQEYLAKEIDIIDGSG